MKQSLTLPMADKLYHDKQTYAFIRSVNVSWEKPEKNHYYLEYSYNRKDWYALNGGFPSTLPCDELSATDTLRNQNPNGETIPIVSLCSLQSKYGKPEPVCIQSVEKSTSTSETVQITYTNGMKENRNIIRNENGVGHIQDNDYATPIISHRADPYIYKHTDGKYYFLGSHTDAGHNLNGTYQYLYIILRCADTLEDLTDNSGRYTEKVIYEREPIGPDRVSPHLWAPEIHYIQGGWYVYYTTTVSDHSSWRIRPHCLACTGNDPMNDPWITKGPIQTTVENDIAFTDFSLDHTFFHHRGEDYFVWAQKTNNISDIFIAKLSNPWTICTPSVLLTHPEYNWELHGFAVNEGPAVIKHEGRIFLTFSASGTDALYNMGLLYAEEDSDLLDSSSWTKLPYPVFHSSRTTGFFGPGHNSFTRSTDDTEDLMVYHARQEERYLGEGDYQPLYDAGRNAYIGKVFWNEDGMPNFSVPGASLAMRKEDLTLPDHW